LNFLNVQVGRDSRVTPSFLSDKIKALALHHGADLVGIASLSRLDELQPQLESVVQSESRDYFTVLDVGRLSKGPFEPKVVSKTIKLKGARDYLPDARSVIVIGMHWFDAVLERAGKPPAEAVGPYGFAQSETIRQLDDIALYVIQSLKAGGYNAAFSYDLHGLAGLVTGSCASGRSYYGMPWRGAGLYPDATANRFAAIAAGLGELGESGLVLTPEYGNRQRFACIITDAEIEATPLYQGPPLCRHCLQCVANCPVRALGRDQVTLKLEGKTFAYRICERLRCDWSKRYALVGAEGPQYIGSQTNIPPPPKITPDNLCAALRQMDPLQKACMVIVEQCVAACPACLPTNKEKEQS
jgi:ferredoxin